MNGWNWATRSFIVTDFSPLTRVAKAVDPYLLTTCTRERGEPLPLRESVWSCLLRAFAALRRRPANAGVGTGRPQPRAEATLCESYVSGALHRLEED